MFEIRTKIPSEFSKISSIAICGCVQVMPISVPFSFSILIGWLGPCVGGHFFLFWYFVEREMTGFQFENGRRCIRQILEDYQAGIGLFFIFSLLTRANAPAGLCIYNKILVFLFELEISDWRRKRRLYSEIERRDSCDFRLSVDANWVPLRFQKRVG